MWFVLLFGCVIVQFVLMQQNMLISCWCKVQKVFDVFIYTFEILCWSESSYFNYSCLQDTLSALSQLLRAQTITFDQSTSERVSVYWSAWGGWPTAGQTHTQTHTHTIYLISSCDLHRIWDHQPSFSFRGSVRNWVSLYRCFLPLFLHFSILCLFSSWLQLTMCRPDKQNLK